VVTVVGGLVPGGWIPADRIRREGTPPERQLDLTDFLEMAED
jgi:hypothetical protein